MNEVAGISERETSTYVLLKTLVTVLTVLAQTMAATHLLSAWLAVVLEWVFLLH